MKRMARQYVWGAVLLAVVICLLVQAGWLLDVPLLKTWLPGGPTMKCLTAAGMQATVLAILASSMSRWTDLRRWRPHLGCVALVLALAPLGMGAWILAVHLQVWPAPSIPGMWSIMPAPATGLSLLLYGCSLFLARQPRGAAWFGICTGLALAVAWLSLLSLVYGSDPGRPNLLFGQVSLPAAVTMLLVCAGLVFLRPYQGVVRIVSSPAPAGRLVRRLLPLAVFLTLLFGLVRLWAQQRWGFTTEFGAAFYSTVTTVILVGVILHHAHTVARLDRLREHTERKIARRHAESERRFRGIFNSTFQFIGLTTPEGVLLETNQSSLDATGVQAADIIGLPFWECPWWEHSPATQEKMRQGIQEAAAGRPVRFQTEYRAADGSLRPVDFSLNPVLDENGRTAFLVPEARDITEHRAATRDLESISQRLRLATLAADIGIWDWNIQTNELVWDELMHQIYQVPSTDSGLDYQVWESRLHPDDRPGVRAALKDALDGVRDFNIIFRIVWPDQSVHYLQTKAIVQRDENGLPLRMLGTNADITQKVMSEAGLLESEERFRHAFEYSAIGLALVDPDGAWLGMNKALCGIVGYTERELLGKSFRDISHPDDLHEEQDNINRLIRGDVTHYQMEKRYLRKDGSIVWVMLTSSLVKETDGSPAYFISQVEDITQRHEAERVLNYQQKQLRMLIEHTPAAVAMFDMDMCYVAASRRWREDYHLQSQPLLGRSHYEVFPEISPEWKAVHQRALAGSVESRDEDRFLRADGQEEWLRWEVRPWREVDGEVGGIVMFTEIITERKNAAENVRASLEEKEVLLREIHHRVKNNMQIISSLLQLQTSALHDPADVAIFQDCQARIHAMAMVHDRLYRSGSLSTINFGEHLRELASLMVRGQSGGMAHIRLDVRCDDVELDLDKAIPLGLIATELITNAFKHAFKGRESGCITIRLTRAEEKKMLLCISDDGIGLPSAAEPHSARTLGLRLVRSLSHQMRAQNKFSATAAGCCVEIAFDV
ncbi:PAS domain S-box protein [Prosthecobacter sp. SYSU 5D2]|uniref:PAS domain S-box protein n=1 Tax=Prosthecobacter sp. SYSU 5D2 TaxID=3134134 RepID=UPI0031FEBF57